MKTTPRFVRLYIFLNCPEVIPISYTIQRQIQNKKNYIFVLLFPISTSYSDKKSSGIKDAGIFVARAVTHFLSVVFFYKGKMWILVFSFLFIVFSYFSFTHGKTKKKKTTDGVSGFCNNLYNKKETIREE